MYWNHKLLVLLRCFTFFSSINFNLAMTCNMAASKSVSTSLSENNLSNDCLAFIIIPLSEFTVEVLSVLPVSHLSLFST